MTTKKFEIVLKYIQDLSVEIPNPEIFLFSREYITKYSLGININTKPLKNEIMIFNALDLNFRKVKLKKNSSCRNHLHVLGK